MATDVKNDANLGTNLIAFYKLEETSGTRVDEVSAQNLTDNNTVTNEAAKQGNGAVFVIANTEYLSGGPAASSLGSTWTVAGWFKISNVATLQCLWSFAQNIFINISATNLRLQIDDNGANRIDSSATTRSNGTFYHIAVTSSGTAAGNTKIWINGTQDDSGTAINVAIDDGNFGIGSQNSAERFFGGTADEVGLWSKVLTQSQIQELYNSGSGIPWDAGGATATGNSHNNLQLLGVS